MFVGAQVQQTGHVIPFYTIYKAHRVYSFLATVSLRTRSQHRRFINHTHPTIPTSPINNNSSGTKKNTALTCASSHSSAWTSIVTDRLQLAEAVNELLLHLHLAVGVC